MHRDLLMFCRLNNVLNREQIRFLSKGFEFSKTINTMIQKGSASKNPVDSMVLFTLKNMADKPVRDIVDEFISSYEVPRGITEIIVYHTYESLSRYYAYEYELSFGYLVGRKLPRYDMSVRDRIIEAAFLDRLENGIHPMHMKDYLPPEEIPGYQLVYNDMLVFPDQQFRGKMPEFDMSELYDLSVDCRKN